MGKYPAIAITEEMINEAIRLIPATKVNRTIASKIDTLTGHLGEFVFAEFLHKNWKMHRVGHNKGQSDFERIEVKTSAFPFNDRLNLLVREDYAQKRKPAFYIQIVIDVPDAKATGILPGSMAYLCGYATSAEIDQAPLRDFGSKLGDKGGYRCHYINIKHLKGMDTLLKALNEI